MGNLLLLEQDLDYLPAKLTCAFCKIVRPWKCFRDHKKVRVFDLSNLSLQLKRNGKELQFSISRISPYDSSINLGFSREIVFQS